MNVFVLPVLFRHERIKALAGKGAEIVTIKHRPKPFIRRVADKVLPASFRFSATSDFYQDLLGGKPDLVVISLGYPYACLHWMEECMARNISYAVINQLVPELTWPDDVISERAVKGYKAARACFFVSENNIRLLTKILGTVPENAEVVRNPYQVAYYNKFAYPASEGGYSLALVGRMDAFHKGQDLLLEVATREKWRSRKISFTLYGTGENEQTLKRLADLWKVENVIFAGHSRNITDVWKNHHAMVLPSRVEGLPLAVVEAMLCRRFAIVTDIGGNREIIDDNINGFIAGVPTADALDEAMERAWQRRGEWEQIGVLASKKIQTKVPEDPVGEFFARIKAL